MMTAADDATDTGPDESSAAGPSGVLGLGLAVMLLGATVAIGWRLDLRLLIQVRDAYAPMHPDAAACFLFLGGAIVLQSRAAWWTALVPAALAVLIGGLAVAEHLLAVDLGFDVLPFAIAPSARALDPGGMGPPAGVAFVLLGLGCLVLRWRPLAAWVLALAVLALGSIALFVYAVGAADALVWGGTAVMAPHTTLGLALASAALVALLWSGGGGADVLAVRQTPLVTGVVAALGALFFWQVLATHQSAETAEATRLLVRTARSEIQQEIAAQVAALRSLARKVRVRGLPTTDDWRLDAAALLQRPDGPLVVDWLSADLTLLRRSARPHLPPFDPAPPPAALVQEAAAEQEPRVSMLTVLETTVTFHIVAPLMRDAELVGVVSGLFHAEDLLATVATQGASEYAVALVEEGRLVARSKGWPAGAAQRLGARTPVDTGHGAVWTVQVAPSRRLARVLSGTLPELALVAGLLIAVLLGAVVREAARARRRARALRASHARLSREVEERRRAEDDVRRLADELEQRVVARTAELASANASLGRENRRRRRAQATLAHANEDLRQFTSFVSHELRQPLASGLIWAELLEKRYADALDDRGRRYVEQLRASITRMGSFLDGQLRLARAALADEFSEDLLELGTLVTEVCESLRSELDEVGAAVTVDPLPAVRADAAQLRQLFRNLIENALKYRRPDVPLRVHVRGAADPHEGVYTVSVDDNGRGFEPAQAAEIFGMFRRLHHDGVEGTGLGLAICRRIMEQHGGGIRAEGRPGEGARFVVELPLERVAQPVPTSDL